MDKRNDAFSSYNPIVNFIFFVGAFAFGMLYLHPIFQVVSVVFSVVYYVMIRRMRSFRFLGGMLAVFLAIMLINPLVNSMGSHVLFYYFENRPYTWEALFYGMVLGAMFVTVMLWFASYNKVMSSDRFLYLFGKWMPSVSLILTLVFSLVPGFKKKLRQIEGARCGIGKSTATGTVMEKAESGMTLISALTSWALEGGVITADSMRSRGYGSGRRTAFSVYRFDRRDKMMLVVMLLLIAGIGYCGVCGAATASYTPEIKIQTWENLYCVVGVGLYAIFLAIPAVINVTEEIKWHFLKSRI